MKRILGSLVFSSLLSGAAVCSATTPAMDYFTRLFSPLQANVTPILSFTSGMTLAPRSGKSKTFPVIDSSTYHFSANRDTQVNGIVDFFVGGEYALSTRWQLQSGLSYTIAQIPAKGTLTQGVDPQSADVFDYHYRVLTQQLLWQTKLLMSWCRYKPYALVAIGPAFNQAGHYVVHNPPFLTFSPYFKHHMQTAFSYMVGLGVDVNLRPHWRLGGGYRFSDFGRVQLGQGRIDTVHIPGTLTQASVYVHELVAEVTYVF